MAALKLSGELVNETTALLSAVEDDCTPKSQTNDEIVWVEGEEEISNDEAIPKEPLTKARLGVLAVLLIGAFISNIDGSLILATYANISSHFNDLESGRWLLTTPILASCAIQPMYGGLSNIYGKKPVLLCNYILFGIGCFISGSAQSMGQLFVGRIIAGMGSAGMVSLVSILISDLVPLKDVALYRSYVNVISTTGRSIGGPLGGYIAQSLGWRWPFFLEVPVTLLAFTLVARNLTLPKHTTRVEESNWVKFKRIDFLGSVCLSSSLVALLLSFDLFARDNSLSDLRPIISVCAGIIMIFVFSLVEKFWAKEPIFPLRLLTQIHTVSSYLIIALQMGAQLGIMSAIPLYFQITQGDSPGKAGAYLVPAVIGNTIGGLLCGFYIQSHARYKLPIIISCISSAISYTLLITRWNGHTNFLESFYTFGGGFGNGVAYSSTFIALAAAVSERDFAIAGSGLYMFLNVGSMSGITISGAVFKWAAKKGLYEKLAGIENGFEIANRALEDIVYVNDLRGNIHKLVVDGYLDGFRAAFVVSLIASSIAFAVSLTIRECKLRA